ncbi:MAG: amidohydrolase, partial [Pseudomonadales bacterium]|nr:amidohydrolase [Pseudomonadales bacterium]
TDSHITEPPDCYNTRIDKKYKDTAPYMTHSEDFGDIFIIDGMSRPVPIGLLAAAGKNPKDMSIGGTKFEDIHKSGWDAKYRVADQDIDGIGAEIIYPTVGMLLCNHKDGGYKKACFDAYNLWLQEFCSEEPNRIFGLGQIAVNSVEEAIEDLRRVKAMGFVGVMMPGRPATSFDYDSTEFDPLWEAAIDLGLPLSFHILTFSENGLDAPRGPKIGSFLSIIRGCQDIISMFIYSGVFDRFPKLQLVCAEADAGWAAHFMHRMDHAYEYHRFWMKAPPLEKMPSDYFKENIWVTFQDDMVAFQCKDLLNIERMCWATDFPHSDSTWPKSQSILDAHTKHLTDDERNLICRDNTAALYNLNLS